MYGKKQGSGDQSNGINFLTWGPVSVSQASRRPAYSLAFCVQDRVFTSSMEFDFRIMRYAVTITPATMPATGFLRVYTCGLIDATGRMLLAGTTAGEVAVFALLPNTTNTGTVALYKTALMASGNGVHSIIGGKHGGVCYVGGGDGSLRCFVGRDLDWSCTAEARLQGRVIATTIASTGTWVLVGTASGHVYRVSFGCDLHGGARGGGRTAVDLLEASHTGPVVAVAFNPNAPDAIATASADQTLRLWNLNTYGVSWGAYAGAGPHPSCVWVAPPCEGSLALASSSSSASSSSPGLPCDIYSGYADGSLRSYAVSASGQSVTPPSAAAQQRGAGAGASSSSAVGAGGEAWKVNAHRGGVTCIAGNRAVVITGGADGRMNVWARRSHDLLLSFNDHSKPVVTVLVDVANPELVYSVSSDRSINTYSLRAERRVRQHALPQQETLACVFTAASQLCGRDSEREVVAATSDGRLFLYDPAIPDSHVGSVDVIALLLARARAMGSAEQAMASVPRARPGQQRPEMRITDIAVSPSGSHIAVVTLCGRLIVLSIGVGQQPAAAGRNAGVAVFTDLSGTVRQQITSSAVNMRVAAVMLGGCPYTNVKWAPDEKQIIATAGDATITVLNWYGSA